MGNCFRNKTTNCSNHYAIELSKGDAILVDKIYDIYDIITFPRKSNLKVSMREIISGDELILYFKYFDMVCKVRKEYYVVEAHNIIPRDDGFVSKSNHDNFIKLSIAYNTDFDIQEVIKNLRYYIRHNELDSIEIMRIYCYNFVSYVKFK